MKLTDFISRKTIVPELKAKDKKGAIVELVRAVKSTAAGQKIAVSEVTQAILEREKLGSTGIGRGIAVPHAKCRQIGKVVGALGRSRQGISFDAIDGEPVHLLFLILSPPNAAERYHRALQTVMHAVKKNSFCNFLRKAKALKELEEVLRDAEEPIQV